MDELQSFTSPLFFQKASGAWEGLQQCRGFEDVHSDTRLSVKCMCLSEAKKPRDFTRLTQEDGSTYKILAICLHFISCLFILSRGNLCNPV